VFNSDEFFFPNIFDVQWVGSTQAEPGDKGWWSALLLSLSS
jgi:hypothetical protein